KGRDVLMDYIEEKDKIKKMLTMTLMKLQEVLPASSQIKLLNELNEDIDNDFYTVMVVGEFKHGKSTFINALIGKDIMPRGVTPTTATINTVHYGQEQNVQIFKR